MADNSASNKRIAKNSLYMSIRMIFVLLISLYTTRAVLKALGVEDYGVYNVVAGFVSMFAFLNNSMASATQRFFNFELGKHGEEGAQVVYNTSLFIHCFLAVLVVIVAIPVGLWYLHHKMVLPVGRMFAAECIFYFSAASLFLTIITVPFTAAVMAHEKMNFYAILGVLDAVLKLAIVLVLPFLSGDSLIWYGALFLSITLFNLVLYVGYCKQHFCEIRLDRQSPRHLIGPMLSFSGWGLLGSFAYILRNQGTDLLLNAFFGPVLNAAKGVATQVNGALNSFCSSILTPSRPQVIQSYSQGNYERTWRLTFSVSKLVTLFYYLMALPICIEINFILHLWLGDHIPAHTSWFVIIILITNTFGSLVAPMSTVIGATGKVKFYQVLSSCSNLLTIPLAYLFLKFNAVPEYVFVAMFITMVTNHLAGLIAAKRYTDFSYTAYTKRVLLPILYVISFTLPFGIVALFVIPEGIVRFLVVFSASVVIVGITTYFIGLDREEKSMVQQLISKVTHRR